MIDNNPIETLLYDVTHNIDTDEKYLITDKNGKEMTLYYLSNTHHGEPTVSLGYIVPDRYR